MPDSKARQCEAAAPEFVAHTRVVAALTLLSRCAGLGRDAVCSRVFGAGPLWSAFALAFVIPNLFRRLFGEGALSAAFLPEYARQVGSDPVLARRFATLVIGSLMVGLGLLVILGEIVLWGVLLALDTGPGQGSAAEYRIVAIHLTMIMLPYMPLICLVALLGAMLQVRGRFAPTAAAPIVLNIFIIAAALLTMLTIDGSAESGEAFSLGGGVGLVAIAVVAAGVVQVLWSFMALSRVAKKTRIVGDLADSPQTDLNVAATDTTTRARQRRKAMYTLMMPMLLGLGVLQFNTLVDSLIAAYPVIFGSKFFGLEYPLDGTSNSILFFTQRLYQFPLGVFGIAVATAVFPALSRTVGNRVEFTSIVQHGLRLSFFIGLPASAGLILVRTPLAGVVLQGGRFGEFEVARVSAVLLGYAVAVWAYSLNHVITRAFYAMGDAMTPVRIAVRVVALNIVLNLILIWPLGESGLAWSTAASAIIQTILLLRASRALTDSPVAHPALVSSWLKTAAATAFMSAVVGAMAWWFTTGSNDVAVGGDAAAAIPDTVSWSGRLVELLILATVGIIAFIIAARVLRMPELGWLYRRNKPVRDAQSV